MWRSVVAHIMDAVWPRAHTGPEVAPIADEDVRQVEHTQDMLRRELIRAETESARLRQQYRTEKQSQ